MLCLVCLVCAMLLLGAGSASVHGQSPPESPPASLTGFTPNRATTQAACEAAFLDAPTPETFRAHLEALTANPHPAGTAANDRVGAYIAAEMEAAGFRIDRYPYDLYMPDPEQAAASVALVTPRRMPLGMQEDILSADRFSDHPALGPGWNAYAASGTVTAEVVYANYGRRADFQQLEAMGVDLTDKLVIARYGGNFRGYKAKYAEEHGAAGLIMYTDPADSGYMRGLPYPEGRYVHESGIQRGSILTPLGGDPLTPDGPALPLDHPDSPDRLAPSEADLPRIPVAPLSYRSAREILSRMQGDAVPAGWQGGLPFTYRVTGGSALTVELSVEQPKSITRATNVVGVLEGTTHPDQWVILGAHFDAWAFGATDPNSGTASLLTLADALGTLEGDCAPRRSILIAHWDAEEYGILGSLEWVRQLKAQLDAGGVAYINADAAATGLRFGGAASPLMKQPVLDAAQSVPHPSDAATVHEHLAQRTGDADSALGNLGGGSDHVGFVTHLGVPSASLAMAGNTPIYHSNYDSFAWYERFGDPSFQSGATLAQVDGLLALRFANADVLPYDVTRYAQDTHAHLDALAARARERGLAFDAAPLRAQVDRIADAATAFTEARDRFVAAGRTASPATNQALLQLSRALMHDDGLQAGGLHRSLYVSPDPFSGYASWMLPGLRYELETDASNLSAWMDRYEQAFARLADRIDAVTRELQ